MKLIALLPKFEIPMIRVFLFNSLYFCLDAIYFIFSGELSFEGFSLYLLKSYGLYTFFYTILLFQSNSVVSIILI